MIFAGADTIWLAAGAMMLMGVSQGANSTIPTAFWAEFYGTRHLGAIRALAVAVMVFGTAIGPVLTGALIDAGIAFPGQMVGIGLYFLAAAALVMVGVARARPLLPAAA